MAKSVITWFSHYILLSGCLSTVKFAWPLIAPLTDFIGGLLDLKDLIEIAPTLWGGYVGFSLWIGQLFIHIFGLPGA